MGLILIIVLFGSSFGYLLATIKKGKFYDRLQYAAVFAIISFILAIIIQIIILRLNLI